MRQATQTLLRDFNNDRLRLVGCEVFFKLLTIAVLGPLTAWIVLQLISMSGHAAISNVDIAGFLLSPLGVITLVLFVALAWSVFCLGQSALLAIQLGRLTGTPKKMSTASAIALRQLVRIVELAIAFVGVFLVIAAPFLAVAGWIYTQYLSEFDINYYLSERPPEFLWSVAAGIVLAAGLIAGWSIVYARTLFSLPECVLNQKRPIAAIKTSIRLTEGKTWGIFKTLIGWWLIYTAIGFAGGVVIQLIESVALSSAGDSFSSVAIAVGLLMGLNFLGTAVLSIYANLSISLVVGRLYWASLAETKPFTSDEDERAVEVHLPALATSDEDTIPDWLRKRIPTVSAKRIGLISLIMIAAISGGCTALLLSTVQYVDKVRVTAHRGSSRAAPENTLAAIHQAIEDGADYAEIDVQETADGAIIVTHDADLMRIAGVNKSLWDANLEEIQEVDAGSWFDPKFSDERIPTLQEVIAVSRNKIKLNVELKFNGHSVDLVRRTMKVIDDADFADSTVISSLKHSSLDEVKRIDPNMRVGAIVGASIGDLSQLDVDFISINAQSLDPTLIRSSHQQGKEVHVWTVNELSQMSDMIELGVDNILTDEPKVLVELLKEREALSATERLLLTFRRLLAY